jgi:hypothetical protein
MYLQADNLVHVYTFEETFGDEYGDGVWNEPSERVSSDLSQNVVALASFYGNLTMTCYLLHHICI